jgi:hypothetical protein
VRAWGEPSRPASLHPLPARRPRAALHISPPPISPPISLPRSLPRSLPISHHLLLQPLAPPISARISLASQVRLENGVISHLAAHISTSPRISPTPQVSLEKVDLAHCDHLTAPHIYGPHLTEIGLAGCSRLGDAALEELCGGCPALRRLNICGCLQLRSPRIESRSLGTPRRPLRATPSSPPAMRHTLPGLLLPSVPPSVPPSTPPSAPPLGAESPSRMHGMMHGRSIWRHAPLSSGSSRAESWARGPSTWSSSSSLLPP